MRSLVSSWGGSVVDQANSRMRMMMSSRVPRPMYTLSPWVVVVGSVVVVVGLRSPEHLEV
jgi:hypothetical protein